MPRPLDRLDCQIVDALQRNARLSNKELAAKVGLAASSCLERVRRLGRERVFVGFHAEVDPGALGVGLQAMIAVRLRRHIPPAPRDSRVEPWAASDPARWCPNSTRPFLVAKSEWFRDRLRPSLAITCWKSPSELNSA